MTFIECPQVDGFYYFKNDECKTSGLVKVSGGFVDGVAGEIQHESWSTIEDQEPNDRFAGPIDIAELARQAVIGVHDTDEFYKE